MQDVEIASLSTCIQIQLLTTCDALPSKGEELPRESYCFGPKVMLFARFYLNSIHFHQNSVHFYRNSVHFYRNS
eukprot:UN02367